jgi:hypothetical protein
MACLYGRAGRLTAENGGSRPGQWKEPAVQDWLVEKDVVRRLGVGLWTGELAKFKTLGGEQDTRRSVRLGRF